MGPIPPPVSTESSAASCPPPAAYAYRETQRGGEVGESVLDIGQGADGREVAAAQAVRNLPFSTKRLTQRISEPPE